jgi:hypothetical protein
MLFGRSKSLGAALVAAGAHSAIGRPLELFGALNAHICRFLCIKWRLSRPKRIEHGSARESGVARSFKSDLTLPGRTV